jgi:signal transduction histidine kinase
MRREQPPVLRVLLVEDNLGDAGLIRAMLSEAAIASVRVRHVPRLAAGLEELATASHDVVLLDLGLPDSQGLDTFLTMRTAAPRLPIVVLSGQADAELALRAVQEGAQDYLMKGHVEPEALLRSLRYAIEHKRIEERQRFLADASRALGGSLDYDATLECVVDLPVPWLADACVVQIDEPRRYLVRDTDLTREAALRDRAEHVCADPVELGYVAWRVVELIANGRLLGRVCVLRTASRPDFDAEELAVVDEFCLRAALAVDNARLYQELHLAVALRDDVLATTAHDLRSPLHGIKLQGTLLRRLIERSPDPGSQQRAGFALNEIEAAIDRSLVLIEELLDAAALQAGRRLELHREPVDLVALTRGVIAQHQARTTFHQLEVRAPDEPLIGEWDALRLSRVLDNLVGNAIKYSQRADPITVALDRERTDSSTWAVIRVCDHGVGIPASEVGRVFDRFYRGSNVARDMRGAGIGLSGVRQIVEQHGGSVGVTSEEGVGSTFAVRLPLPRGVGSETTR